LLSNFHRLVRAGSLTAIRARIDEHPSEDLHAFDQHGHTPLMVAVQSDAPVEVVDFLIEKRARLDDVSRGFYGSGQPVLALAIRKGDLRKVALLIEKGADINYSRSGGYDALVDAAFAQAPDESHLVDLLKLLIRNGAALNTTSIYGESALGVLSRYGHFDAVRGLLDAGADPGCLGWNELHRAVALGSLEEVESLVDNGADIEMRDTRYRTPFLLAVQTGVVKKSECLMRRGANSRAQGHCGAPPLFFAIENHHEAMVDWLLRTGADIEQIDEFGATPLMTATDCDNATAVRALLAAGANTEAQKHGQTALAEAGNREIMMQLLNAGADIRQLTHEGQRILIGLGKIFDDPLLDVTGREFEADCSPRFGVTNPERMIAPFWEAMIRAGVSASEGAQICNPGNQIHPIWCAQRFGQSLTSLPDGRIIQIAGESEDFYNEDFCIFNDVFVHQPDGTIQIFGYPREVFPPTDFHSATLIGKHIYVIGSLSYIELYGVA
jgi:ankyrin repeat protein